MANTTIYPYGQNGSLPGEDIIELDPIFTESPAYGITSADITNWNSKTSNTGTVTQVKIGTTAYNPSSGIVSLPAYPSTAADVGAQPTLVSGTNIKTINNESLLGSGNISIAGGTGSGEVNVIEAITFNGTPATITNKTAAITATIPSEVTESTVSGWGFTKNTGTYSKPSGGIPASDLATGVVPVELGSDSVLVGVETTIKAIEASDGTYVIGSNNADGTEDYVLATTNQIPTESTVSGWGFTKNAAPGTLKTNNTIAQTASASESLSGTINLHKVAKTGTYSDLIGTPTIPTESTVSGWGFTKNTGTLTGVTFNGTSATVSNGVAAITATIPNITVSSSEPTSSQGSNGDIWIVV